MVPHGNYLTGLHQSKVQSWTKVLRRRRFELLSGPLFLTSDTVHRDTSGERAANVNDVTPDSRQTPCALHEAHSPKNWTGGVAEQRHWFGATLLVSPLTLTAGQWRFIHGRRARPRPEAQIRR